MTRQEYNKLMLKQKLALYGMYISVRVDAWMCPTMIAYKNHIYHVNNVFSAKDNSRLSAYQYGDNGWSDKNKMYDLPGAECFCLSFISL